LNAPKRRTGRAVGLVLVGLVAVASLGYADIRSKRQNSVVAERKSRAEKVERGPRVEMGAVEETAAGRQVSLPGEVRAYRQATLYAKVSGYVRVVRVDKGDRVKQNEVLGVLEAPEVEQQAASTRADLALKRVTEKRVEALAPSGAVSQQELDQSRAQVNQLNAELARIEAMRGYSVIRAPFAGVITQRYADPGALLQAATGATQSALPLVDIADIERVRIVVYLGQSEALFVHEGDHVELWNESKPDLKVTAAVSRFSRSLDPRTRTMLTEIEVPNPNHEFYPGTFVRVRLTLATPPSLVVPMDAVVFKDGKSQVAAVDHGNVHFMPVEVDSPDGKTVRVVQGIGKGGKVVLHPGDDIIEGISVQAEAPRPPKR
jgi:RND family efflux transporter MFP subunit